MDGAVRITPWQHAAAIAAEGQCLLAAVIPYPVALLLPPAADIVRPAVPLLLFLLLSAPALLGRQGYYVSLCRIGQQGGYSLGALGSGWCHFGRAVGWYWQWWLRRGAVFALAAAPAVLLWKGGADGQAVSPLWFAAGWVVLACGWGAGRLWLCRYAAAPLLLLEGYPAVAALQLSVRVMRRHRLEYVSFWLTHAGRVAACLLVIPAIWLLPRLHREQTALLLRFREESGVPTGQ